MNSITYYLNYISALKGSVKYHKWAYLTCLSALLERRVWLDRGRLGILFPNMYTLLVGPPATGKSFSGEQATSLLTQLVYPPESLHLKIGPTKITQAALYKELKDAERPLQLPGCKPYVQSPLFIYASELAVNLVDFGGGTLTNELIDFYDSKGLDTVVSKRTIKDDTLNLWNPSITMLGCTTEGFLQNAANQKLITSGLSSRIIFVVEPDRVEKQRDYIQLDLQAKKLLLESFMRLYSMKGPMHLNSAATETFKRIAENADTACFDTASEFLQNYYGRKPDHICKVALILAASEGRYVIHSSDLEQAEAWIHEIEPDMAKAFGCRSIEHDDTAVNYILALIPYAPKMITKSELFGKLLSGGMFMPDNGIFKALAAGLKTGERITIQVAGAEEIYSRLS